MAVLSACFINPKTAVALRLDVPEGYLADQGADFVPVDEATHALYERRLKAAFPGGEDPLGQLRRGR